MVTNKAKAKKEKESTAAIASNEKKSTLSKKSIAAVASNEKKSTLSKKSTAAVDSNEKKSTAVHIPTLNHWVHNQDMNNISGEVTGHHEFKDGKLVHTSELRKGIIQEGYVVQTISGSKYYLGPKAEEEEKKKKKKKATNIASIPAEVDTNTEANAKKKKAANKASTPVVEAANKASTPAVEVEEKKASTPVVSKKASTLAVEVEEKKASTPAVEVEEKKASIPGEDKAFADAVTEGDILFKYSIILAQQGLLEIAKKKGFTRDLAAKFLKRYGVGYDGVIGGIAPDNNHLMLEIESLSKMSIS